MKTLVIPDIHENPDALEEILTIPCDQRVFLGDWFDTFHGHRWQDIIDAIYAAKKRGDILLFGNHDCHYAFTHGGFKCSGYQPALNKLLRTDHPDLFHGFKVWHEVDDVLLSHAGFRTETLHLKDTSQKAIDIASEGGFHPLWAAGRSRGGSAEYGGPTWLDFSELDPPANTQQIVGHSHGKFPRFHPTTTQDVNDQEVSEWAICIDTSLRHLAWIDGDNIWTGTVAQALKDLNPDGN